MHKTNTKKMHSRHNTQSSYLPLAAPAGTVAAYVLLQARCKMCRYSSRAVSLDHGVPISACHLCWQLPCFLTVHNKSFCQTGNLKRFVIDIYNIACWQALLPHERLLETNLSARHLLQQQLHMQNASLRTQACNRHTCAFCMACDGQAKLKYCMLPVYS